LKKVAVIRGDGTGPELIDATLEVIKASGAKVEFIVCEGGMEWWERNRASKPTSFIPDESWKVLEEADCALKGPTTTLPVPGTPRSVAVSIRQRFNLYANVRPLKTFPNHVSPLGQVNFVMVREATEGLYSGLENRLTDDVAVATRLITRTKSKLVSRFAFDEAKRRGWTRVVAISKANILKITDGLFLESVREVARRYRGIELEDLFIDNFAQQLVKNPQRFNRAVVVGTNLFMDILSEEASGLLGSVGLVYSGNFGPKYAMFEPAHGSTPKYAGKNKVNPTATILSAAWMLDYLGEAKASKAIFSATMKVIAEGASVTYDLGGRAGTRQMAQAVARLL
jgi:isocitrate dehydrogenase (NAD+)